MLAIYSKDRMWQKRKWMTLYISVLGVKVVQRSFISLGAFFCSACVVVVCGFLFFFFYTKSVNSAKFSSELWQGREKWSKNWSCVWRAEVNQQQQHKYRKVGFCYTTCFCNEALESTAVCSFHSQFLEELTKWHSFKKQRAEIHQRSCICLGLWHQSNHISKTSWKNTAPLM